MSHLFKGHCSTSLVAQSAATLQTKSCCCDVFLKSRNFFWQPFQISGTCSVVFFQSSYFFTFTSNLLNDAYRAWESCLFCWNRSKKQSTLDILKTRKMDHAFASQINFHVVKGRCSSHATSWLSDYCNVLFNGKHTFTTKKKKITEVIWWPLAALISKGRF